MAWYKLINKLVFSKNNCKDTGGKIMKNNINDSLNRNRQNDFQGSEVRSTRQVISYVHAIVGGALLGVGILVSAMNFLFDHHIAVRVLLITGGSLALSGIIELIVSIIFRRSANKDQAKLARLKSEGVMFTGEITRIQRHFGLHLGRSYSIYVECSYKNHDGKSCLVRSQSFLHQNEDFPIFLHHRALIDILSHDNYSALVYVDPYNPHDYAVEIFRNIIGVQSDYDYR